MADIPLPIEVEELTPAWFSLALGRQVTRTEVTDRHSGTTGRACVALEGDGVALEGDGVPATVFVKLPPFDAAQRRFVDNVGMGITEARLARPRDGCRLPSPADDDIAERALDIAEQLAPFHARYWESDRFRDGDLAGVAPNGEGSCILVHGDSHE